jgi:hypothetical protein
MIEWGVSAGFALLCVLLYLWVRYEKGSYNNLVLSWEDEKESRLEEQTRRRAAEAKFDELLAGLQANERLLVAQARIHDALVKERDEVWAQYQTTVSQLANGQSVLAQQVKKLLVSYNEYRKQRGDDEIKLDPFVAHILDKED